MASTSPWVRYLVQAINIQFNTIIDNNRVIVLDQGNIAEFDSPDLLANKETIFYSMAKKVVIYLTLSCVVELEYFK